MIEDSTAHCIFNRPTGRFLPLVSLHQQGDYKVRPLGGAYTIQVAPGQSSEPSGSGCISSDNAFISSRGLLIIAAEWIA
jgi:hypothetical protein